MLPELSVQGFVNHPVRVFFSLFDMGRVVFRLRKTRVSLRTLNPIYWCIESCMSRSKRRRNRKPWPKPTFLAEIRANWRFVCFQRYVLTPYHCSVNFKCTNRKYSLLYTQDFVSISEQLFFTRPADRDHTWRDFLNFTISGPKTINEHSKN